MVIIFISFELGTFSMKLGKKHTFCHQDTEEQNDKPLFGVFKQLNL